MTATFSLTILSFFGVVLSAYPHYAHNARDNQSPPYPVQPPPQYLVYPHGIYQLTNATNNTHHVKEQDFVFGHKAPQDKLLLHTTVYKRPGIWSSYASKEITFPPPGSAMRVNITQVNAHDRGVNATGGFVKLIRGGIGRENVTLLFRQGYTTWSPEIENKSYVTLIQAGSLKSHVRNWFCFGYGVRIGHQVLPFLFSTGPIGFQRNFSGDRLPDEGVRQPPREKDVRL